MDLKSDCRIALFLFFWQSDRPFVFLYHDSTVLPRRNVSERRVAKMKCSKLIDKLQQLEYVLDDPDVVLKIGDEYDGEIEIEVEQDGAAKTVVLN
jgi:hypothetical protein